MRFATLTVLILSAALGACGTDEALPAADDARRAAVNIVGGQAEQADRLVEDGFDLWEVEVAMTNGSHVDVLLFADSGDLFEVEDKVGPFNYEGLDPLPGKLTYAEARAIAQGRVMGLLEAWEVKFTDEGYFYEYYQRQDTGQLWEVKLWADSGEIFVVEPKTVVD